MRWLTSWRIISRMANGDFIIGTGCCGRVPAAGQMWVWMMTLPSSTSPRLCISISWAAAASATTAPSLSETSPVTLGRAPTPPRRPTMPRRGASALLPGISMAMKSVDRPSWLTGVTVMLPTPKPRR
ncbi:hypothetical protein D3C78_1317680 [compost metagenome]